MSTKRGRSWSITSLCLIELDILVLTKVDMVWPTSVDQTGLLPAVPDSASFPIGTSGP